MITLSHQFLTRCHIDQIRDFYSVQLLDIVFESQRVGEEFVSNLTHVTKLTISDCFFITDIWKNMSLHSLTSVAIMNCAIDNHGARALSGLLNLRYMTLQANNLTPYNLIIILKGSRFKMLCVNSNPVAFTNDTCYMIGKWLGENEDMIQSIYLNGNNMNHEMLTEMIGEVKVNSLVNFTSEMNRFESSAVGMIRRAFPNLKGLDLENCGLNNDAVRELLETPSELIHVTFENNVMMDEVAADYVLSHINIECKLQTFTLPMIPIWKEAELYRKLYNLNSHDRRNVHVLCSVYTRVGRKSSLRKLPIDMFYLLAEMYLSGSNIHLFN